MAFLRRKYLGTNSFPPRKRAIADGTYYFAIVGFWAGFKLDHFVKCAAVRASEEIERRWIAPRHMPPAHDCDLWAQGKAPFRLVAIVACNCPHEIRKLKPRPVRVCQRIIRIPPLILGCAPSHCPPLPMSVRWQCFLAPGRTQMGISFASRDANGDWAAAPGGIRIATATTAGAPDPQ
jgi:hypothetical protein